MAYLIGHSKTYKFFSLGSEIFNLELSIGSHSSELEQQFDVIGRKTSVFPNVVDEVDIAKSFASFGFPDFQIQQLKDGSFFVDQSGGMEKVYAIGFRDMVNFSGKLSNAGLGNRFYGLLFRKGFLDRYSHLYLDRPSPPGGDRRAEFFEESHKVLVTHHEGKRTVRGQVHALPRIEFIDKNGVQFGIGDFIRRHAVAVVEFDREGRVIDIVKNPSMSLVPVEGQQF